MSGYQTTELVLASIPRPVWPALERIEACLHERFRLSYLDELHRLVENHAQAPHYQYLAEAFQPEAAAVEEALDLDLGVQLTMELLFGSIMRAVVLFLVPAPNQQVGLIWKLDSYIYEAVRDNDRELGRLDPTAKARLLEFILSVAEASGTSAFHYGYDDNLLRPRTAEEIGQALAIDDDGVFMIAGFHYSHLSLKELQLRVHGKDPQYVCSSVSGMNIFDIVHASDD